MQRIYDDMHSFVNATNYSCVKHTKTITNIVTNSRYSIKPKEKGLTN